MKTNISKLFNIEINLNRSLNSKYPYDDINQRFDVLFSDELYSESFHWLSGDIDGTISIHDGIVKNLSERKNGRLKNISFNIDFSGVYKDKRQIGYMTNAKFKISSSGSFRKLHKKTILNFLIDNDRKEIGFIYIEKGKSKYIIEPYENIEFKYGEININQ